MASAAEADRGHAGGECGVDTGRTVLDYKAALGRRRELLRGITEQIGRRLSPRDHRRTEEVLAKPREQARQLEL